MHARKAIFTVICGLLPLALFPQAGTEASFFGTVVDSSGAIVPGAEITVNNLATGFTRTIKADSEGNFNLLALPLGGYSVSVTAPGFKKWQLARTDLSVGDRSRLSPVLEVGQIAETVAVQDTVELLQTEKGSVATVVQLQPIRELPLATRNPLALVAMVPGMRWTSTQEAGERATYVQGQGYRENKTNFQLDGLNSNAPMDEGGTAIPNVDTIAEFSVQTNSFSAEMGRDPIQVLVVTKSGTNEFHGSLWEFVQNDKFNARNTFAVGKNRVRRNQFGGSVGGPIIRNRTFFFGSFENTRIRNESVYNSLSVTPAMKTGDFSALSKTITNPYDSGRPFPQNRIPASMITSASKYFLPLILEPNSPTGYFKANAASSNDVYEGTIRVDHFINTSQRIYGRYVRVRQPLTRLGYNPIPAITGNDEVNQHNIGLNYTWTISANTLLTASGGVMRTNETYSNPALGKENESAKAGIQGIPTAGREKYVGPPDISFGSGYVGVSFPGGFGVPGSLWGDVRNGKVAFTHIRGNHTFATGYEYGDWHNFGNHGSDAVRGTFGFGNLYTKDGFADYLLGLMSSSQRNDPSEGGQDRAPYMAGYVQDTWRVRSNLTVDVGVRYERWLARHNVGDLSSTWDPDLKKMVVAVNKEGKINLTAFPITPYLAAATQGLWISAREAGYPDSLYYPPGRWAPRFSVVYRPFANKSVVLRAGYGMFYNKFTGNRGSSTRNIPFWTRETLSIGLNTLQRWETAWPEPGNFQPFTIYAPAVDVEPPRMHEWNISLQTALPFKSALTLSYVGTRSIGEFAMRNYNAAPIGYHANLQADRPLTRYADINRYENMGRTWYNALQTNLERRFASGISFSLAYTLSRSMMDGAPDCEMCALVPYSPDWYNRGRQGFDIHHIEYATLVWEMPFGRGKKYLGSMNRVANVVLGGWQLAATQQARSGSPLSVSTGISNLGNGYGTRANIVGDPHLDNPTPAKWFNTAAFAQPAMYTFGNSALGILEGPGYLSIETSLSKKFYISESKYFQFRWESFNISNRVNYNSPTTSMTSSNFGKITGAGAARYMQFGLKFLF